MQNYGGFWLRFVAALIDGIIMFIAQAIVMLPFGIGIGMMTDASDSATGAGVLLNVAVFLLQWLYFAIMESSPMQATLGKKALGLIVTDKNGGRIGFGRATGRYFGKILSALILLIGYIMAGFTERKQALHDMIAGTLVLKGQPGMTTTDPDVFA